MSYLLSFLTSESPEKDTPKVLCCYVNASDTMQLVNVINQAKCEIQCVIYPEERILFLASSDANLQVNSLKTNEIVLNTISCQSLNLHRDFTSCKAVVKPSLQKL